MLNPQKPLISITFLFLLCYFIDNLFLDEDSGYLRLVVFDSVLALSQISPCQALLFEIYDLVEHMMNEGEYNMVVRDRTFRICQVLVTNALDY